jgi:hypothetical protein
VKEFIRSILCKKVNQRNCSFTKLKSAEFFNDFQWDDLIDFKLKAPYIPETHDWSKHVEHKTHLYEKTINVFKIIT